MRLREGPCACAAYGLGAVRCLHSPFLLGTRVLGARAQLHLETRRPCGGRPAQGVVRIARLAGILWRKPRTPYVAALFEQGSPFDERVVGDLYLRAARDGRGTRRPRYGINCSGVAAAVRELNPKRCLRQPSGGLARALVDWYALRSGSADIARSAAWFQVSAASWESRFDICRWSTGVVRGKRCQASTDDARRIREGPAFCLASNAASTGVRSS